MKTIIIFLNLFTAVSLYSINLPIGVTVYSAECNFNKGKFSYSFFKNNEMIGSIQPRICHDQNYYEEEKIDNRFIAEFLNDKQE